MVVAQLRATLYIMQSVDYFVHIISIIITYAIISWINVRAAKCVALNCQYTGLNSNVVLFRTLKKQTRNDIFNSILKYAGSVCLIKKHLWFNKADLWLKIKQIAHQQRSSKFQKQRQQLQYLSVWKQRWWSNVHIGCLKPRTAQSLPQHDLFHKKLTSKTE